MPLLEEKQEYLEKKRMLKNEKISKIELEILHKGGFITPRGLKGSEEKASSSAVLASQSMNK